MTDWRSRSTLARSQLIDFASFCAGKGWKQSDTSGPYEVLRMRHPDWKEPLIVHQKNDVNSMHLTTWGNSADMLRRYLRSKQDDRKSKPCA